MYLFDVDNTLLDNDAIIDALRAHLIETFAAVAAQRYWDGFESLRSELGYADYLGALQRYRVNADTTCLRDADDRHVEMAALKHGLQRGKKLSRRPGRRWRRRRLARQRALRPFLDSGCS